MSRRAVGRERRSPQISRIARLLEVEADEVTGLDGLSDEDLRTFHDQISRSLFADGQARFARVAGLSKTIPGPLAGKLAEKFLPPVLAARVSELLEPARARDLVNRVRVGYLADIAIALDPVRSRPVVQALPAKRIGEVAREMFGRREYVVMAEFVNTVTLDALVAALHEATPHDLLAVVPLLEWNDNLDQVIATLPEPQIRDIVETLDPAELAELALALDPTRFGPIVALIDPTVVAEIASELFSRGEHRAMARLAPVVTVEMLEAVLGVAEGGDLLAVVPHLRWNKSLEKVFAAIPDKRLDALLAQMVTEERWSEGGAVLKKLDARSRDRILGRVPHLTAPRRTSLDTAIATGAIDVAPELAKSLEEHLAAARN